MNQDTINYIVQNIPTILFGLVCLAILIISMTWKGTRNPVRLKKRVSSILRKFALLRQYKVLDNLTLTVGTQTVTIDHLLVGNFGLIFVTDLVGRGDYYGELDDKNWVCNTFNKRDEATLRVGSYENPLHHNQNCMKVVREILSAEKIFGIAMEDAAVSTHKRGDFLVTGGTNKAFNLRGLSPFLNKEKFQVDKGVDVEKITALLQSKQNA